MNLKRKTIIGIGWNSFEKMGGVAIQTIVTIVLARILNPSDFGVIGLLAIFTGMANVLLDSGFSQALIRKQDANDEDFSSIFYFNIIIGFVVYLLLYLSAPAISDFYRYPELKLISRVVFLTVIIDSFGVIQNAKIVKEINFKVLAKRTIIANSISGLLAIYLATKGFEVWALVVQLVLAAFLRLVFLWSFTKWLPAFKFSVKPIKELFGFSGNLLVSGFVDVFVSNIQTLLIGRYYTRADLGYYSQGKQLTTTPSQTLTAIIRNVTYPSMSLIQNDKERLKQAYRKIIKLAVFIVFPLMIGLMAIGNILIPAILGNKWNPAIPYFMLLCITGAVFPLFSISVNLFLVRGNSKLYLKVSLWKRVIMFIFIITTIRYSVLALVIGQVIATIINTLIVMYYSGKEVDYSMLEQLKDIKAIVFISLFMCAVVYYFGQYHLINSAILTLICQFILGVLIFLGLAAFFRISALADAKDILFSITRGSNV